MDTVPESLELFEHAAIVITNKTKPTMESNLADFITLTPCFLYLEIKIGFFNWEQQIYQKNELILRYINK